MRELRKGDKVKYLNDIGEAEVIDVLPNGKVLLEDENGFDIEVHSRELLLVNTDEQDLYNNKLPDIPEILDLEIDEKKRKTIEENFQRSTRTSSKSTVNVGAIIGWWTYTFTNLLITSVILPTSPSSIFS